MVENKAVTFVRRPTDPTVVVCQDITRLSNIFFVSLKELWTVRIWFRFVLTIGRKKSEVRIVVKDTEQSSFLDLQQSTEVEDVMKNLE